VRSFESGRRLCLLLEAGPCRFAVAATSVLEVAEPDPDGRTLRGVLELRDLSVLLGGPPQPAQGRAVVLDVSPTLALKVGEVRGVVDVARDPLFGIPPLLSEALSLFVRGALLHEGELFLELIPEALPHRPVLRPPSPRSVYMLERPPERALVFESQGVRWGLPLPLVSQIVSRDGAFLPLLAPHGALTGMLPHQQALWPVLSVPALIGGQTVPEELVVLAELAGEPAGLQAARVVGVLDGFCATEGRGEFTAAGGDGPVLFLDYQTMFS
jgi:hypothetical protein